MWLVQHPVQPAHFDPWYVQSHSRCTHLKDHHEHECQIDPVENKIMFALVPENEGRKRQQGTIFISPGGRWWRGLTNNTVK